MCPPVRRMLWASGSRGASWRVKGLQTDVKSSQSKGTRVKQKDQKRKNNCVFRVSLGLILLEKVLELCSPTQSLEHFWSHWSTLGEVMSKCPSRFSFRSIRSVSRPSAGCSQSHRGYPGTSPAGLGPPASSESLEMMPSTLFSALLL